jgi:flagellar motor component MotA
MSIYGLVFVLLGGTSLALVSFDVREIWNAFKEAGRSVRSQAETHKSIVFWESASRNFWMTGVLGTLVAFVVALTTSEGGIQGITIRMANSLVPTVYGAIFSVVCLLPALRLRAHRDRDVTSDEHEEATSSSILPTITGYIIFIAMILGILFYADMNAREPIFTAWGWLATWPSILIVLGGTLAIALFVGTATGGQSFTFGFAATGFIGSLMGCIQVIQGFAARSIEEISTAMTFVLSSCFYSLLGMMLLGAPLEDRALRSSARVRQSTMSRVAWTIFPLVTLILIIVTFILVITPMTVPK